MIEIDDQGRMAMKALREGVSEARYLDDVWHRRDEAQGHAAPDRARWPFVRTPSNPDARVNVERMPLKLRNKA